MWSTEGKMSGGNIYENHAAQPMLVTALVHNDETGDKSVLVTVPPSGTDIRIGVGKSMAFTVLIEGGRAISCTGKCRFHVSIHAKLQQQIALLRHDLDQQVQVVVAKMKVGRALYRVVATLGRPDHDINRNDCLELVTSVFEGRRRKARARSRRPPHAHEQPRAACRLSRHTPSLAQLLASDRDGRARGGPVPGRDAMHIAR
jgi:hypothetical protein